MLPQAQAPRAKPSNPNTSEPQRISGLSQVLSMGVGKMTNRIRTVDN